MIEIDPELLERLAGLARLGLSTEERGALRDELETILAHFQAIQDVDTEGVAPLAHVLTSDGQPSADVVDPYEDSRSRLVHLSASHREGFFVVPRVVEGPDRESTGSDADRDADDEDPSADEL